MAISANRYANRVFSEHPIAMWTMDEDTFYLSQIDDEDRLFTNWTLVECTANNSTIPPASPPIDTQVFSTFVKNTGGAGILSLESQELFNSTQISTEINTFTVNLFLYFKPVYVNWIKIGIRYDDALANPVEIISEEIPPPSVESWANIQQTYDIPSSWSTGIKVFIEVSMKDSSADVEATRTFTMSGFSVGQASETTCYESLGVTQSSLPAEVGLAGFYGVSADQYGVLYDNGYNLIRNNQLLARNNGLPIIFGTDHSTKIYPSPTYGYPSFIFPGKGMLHEKGRNKTYTLEMWIKIDPLTTTALKIIGPMDGNDGLYVKEGFLTLVVGDEIESFCVAEWYRPMLLHVIFKESNATVLINGEEVINIPFDRITVNLSNQRDWWGIYSYPSIGSFYIDCISIFPYIVSTIVAKRRFVYGQGTSSAQSIDSYFDGVSTEIDFSTTEYDASIIYPDIARWDSGYFNNLDATREYIAIPDYDMPLINLGTREVQQWYNNNYIVNTLEYPDGNHPKFITFRPNISYDAEGNPISWNPDGINYTEQSYLNFQSLNVLNDTVSAVYGIFQSDEDVESVRTLISFVNITNGEFFDITINSDVVEYSINGQPLYSEVITIGKEFLVGINFDEAGINFGYLVSQFFSSPSSIQMYVGGNGFNTFEGKIYLVGFCNGTNYEQIVDNFYNDNNVARGIAKSENYEILFNHLASYTLVPEYEYGHLFLDISVQSQWEEYFPLSYFASYVKDEDGNLVYDLDMLQVNVGATSIVSTSAWNYLNLKEEFSSSDYLGLKNSIYSNYFNLKKKNTTGTTINVSESTIQTYITFQPLASGANSPLSSFNYGKGVSEKLVIRADEENTIEDPEKVYKTIFSFRDNTIVFPPKSKPFEDYAMVVHIIINQRSSKKNPLRIRKFEISAKNMNYNSIENDLGQRNFIGTKFGKKLYPQSNNMGVNDYKVKNPYTVYKTNTPYIYTTRNSGIRVAEETYTSKITDIKNEIFLPINESASYNFKVSALQFMINPDFTNELESTKVLEIRHRDGFLSFIAEKLGDYAKVSMYTRSSNNQEVYMPTHGAEFYQNGRYVKTPILRIDEWESIGILLPTELSFSEYSEGGIALYGGFTFNNISYYLSEGLGTESTLLSRTWQNILDGEDTPPALWSYWSGFDWQYVYILGQDTYFSSTPKNIYDVYMGTNNIVIDDNQKISIQQKEVKALSNVSWSSFIEKPA